MDRTTAADGESELDVELISGPDPVELASQRRDGGELTEMMLWLYYRVAGHFTCPHGRRGVADRKGVDG
jgi:hypothetical protein